MKNTKRIVILSAILLLAVVSLIAGCTQGSEGIGENGSIVGIITDSTTGNPIEGVTVTAGEKTGESDQQGRYFVSPLKQGDYTLTAVKEGYENYSTAVTIQGEQTAVVSFEMIPEPLTGSVSGKVTAQWSEMPLEGVTVTIGDKEDITDEEGNYTIIDVPARNEKAITAQVDNYLAYNGTVNVVAGDDTEHDITMIYRYPRIESGAGFGISLKSDGTVWTWGGNCDGQLGDGTTINNPTPSQVLGFDGEDFLEDIIAITAGQQYSLVLDADGTLWAWGNNYNGRLGDGTDDDRYTPVQVVGPDGVGLLTNVIGMTSGGSFGVAIQSDNTVWTWGGNCYGQLGDGTTDDSLTPVQVVGPDGVGFLQDIIAVDSGRRHTVALKSDGTVWAWGYNNSGQLGNDSTDYSETPVQVMGPEGEGFLDDVIAVSAGGGFSVALKSDGTLWAWGGNCYGQLGDGTSDNSYTPIQVQGPDGVGFINDIITVNTGRRHTIAVKSDGTVWTWGYNYDGQLGDGETDDSYTPVQVKGPGGVGFLGNIVEVAAEKYHSFAMDSDGNIWAWGYNSSGRLGDGTENDSLTPVQTLINLFTP